MLFDSSPRLYSAFFLTLCISFFSIKAQAQKGEKSITVAPVISFPLDDAIYSFGELGTGFGLEVTGQQNISAKSALLVQANFCTYSTSVNGGNYGSPYASSEHQAVYSIRAGYQFQFGKSGILLNGLPGLEFESDFDPDICLVLGVGKRFQVKKAYFIDAGIDIYAAISATG